MKIGELAKASATPIETIRYYEREGLLPAPARTEGNFRVYEATHLERLQFIRQAKDLGFTLSEIRELLALKVAPGKSCADVRARAESKIADIEQRVGALGGES